jgi:hypothetical protein
MPTQEALDVARRAEQLYADKLKSKLEASHLYKFLAIEPESEAYFLGDSLSEAMQAARRANPGRICFGMRIGSPIHIGAFTS